MNTESHYQIEQKLFALFAERIEEENPDPDEGVKRLIHVLNVQVHLSRLLAEGTRLSLGDYSLCLEGAFEAGKLIAALQENHPEDASDEETQAGRLIGILSDTRHDLEGACWETEELQPEHREFYRSTRDHLASEVTIH